MNVYFSGVGGSGVGPLAEIAQQIGYRVSGSDKQESSYIEYLKKNGISDIYIGQTAEQIATAHTENPIDWLVYSSAVMMENPDSSEFKFARENNIRMTKRDEFLNHILHEKNLDLIAIAGTHGKTTTIAMTVWLMQNLDIPISYLLPAKTSFAKMGEYNPESKYFIYEADEFDRNFLHFSPSITMISGVAYDHQEIFPTLDDYKSAFREFIDQSGQTFLWEADAEFLDLSDIVSTQPSKTSLPENTDLSSIYLAGKFNRRDAMLVVKTIQTMTGEPLEKLTEIMSRFPGLGKRMEKIAPNLYVNYAHTPEKLIAGINAASETLNPGQKLVILYEPLTNRRQHYFIDSYKNVFSGATKLYWLPSYLAREDSDLPILSPDELISHLDEPTQKIAESAGMNNDLIQKVHTHLADGDLVVAMIAGDGNDSLDHWLRTNFGEI